MSRNQRTVVIPLVSSLININTIIKQTDKHAALLTLHKAAILEAKHVADDVASNARVKLRRAFTDMAQSGHSSIYCPAGGEFESSSELASGPEYDADPDDLDGHCLIGLDLYGSK